MTDYERQEILRIFLNKTRGNEPWFDYSPADVMFWETVHMILEEYNDKTNESN